MDKQIVTINSRKFDGRIHRSWQCELLEETDELFILTGEFEKEVSHKHLGVIRPKTLSYEFYWKNHWFNVFRFHEPEGEFRNFYCNINQPPTFQNNVLDYVDLDIDVLVWRDFSRQILDLDEFAENAKKFLYPKDLIEKARESLSELLSLIENKSFPFDFKD